MYQDRMLLKYGLAGLIGILMGFKILPAVFTGILFGGLMIAFLIYTFNNKIEEALLILPFIVFGEIFFRGHARAYLPYLSVQYMYIIGFGTLLAKNKLLKKNFHFPPIAMLLSFFVLEILNGFLAEKLIVTRGIQTNTLALLLPALWASFYKFSPKFINKILDNVRIATVFLAGIVLVAHLQGKIDYGNASNSDASSNMAPVQLSAYLGLGSILFLISVLNPFDKRSKIIQVVFLIVIATLMVLTFSRGGLYFLGVVALLYLFFNRTNFGSYFKFLIFLPIGLIIYNFVVVETGGKIIDRYNAQGASNREELVRIGFLIYLEHPVIGIGTGNYNTYIKTNKLFPLESGAHNEFVRAAAEHGTIGIILFWGFFLALLRHILLRPKPARDYGVYFLVLFALITVHNGLKVSVQPFLLILAIAITPVLANTKQMTNVSAKQHRA